jgi:DNA-binding beta-propeller fold protein YncE
MFLYKNKLYILSATTNTIQILDTINDLFVDDIQLNTKGFSSKIYQVEDSQYAIVTDASENEYSVLNLEANELIKNTSINIPILKMVIAPEGRKN